MLEGAADAGHLVEKSLLCDQDVACVGWGELPELQQDVLLVQRGPDEQRRVLPKERG
jgi:hypothetical protein